MKILYIEGKSNIKPSEYFIDENLIKKLPNNIFLVYSIQFKCQALVMKKALESNGIHVRGFKQVLGCTKLKTHYPILLVGQGRFHAFNLAVQNPEHPLIIYSNGSSYEITKRELEEIQKKKKAALNMFMHAENIGIIISTKSGQENMRGAENIGKKILKKYPEKKIFLMISNNINVREFENFTIDFYINTACPGIALDSPKIINADDILSCLL